jgi:hypothetical protein
MVIEVPDERSLQVTKLVTGAEAKENLLVDDVQVHLDTDNKSLTLGKGKDKKANVR